MNTEGDDMAVFNMIIDALILGAVGGVGIREAMMWLKRRAAVKAERNGRGELTDGTPCPGLPVYGSTSDEDFRAVVIHGQPPYRHTEDAAPDPAADPYETLDPVERFRRFVVAVNELPDLISIDDLMAMAVKIDRTILIDTIERYDLDTPNEKAAVLAFVLRNDPADTDAISEVITRSEYPEVCISALKCFKGRPPQSDSAIAAVFLVSYEECPWCFEPDDGDDGDDGSEDDGDDGDEDNRETEAVELANEIIDGWKKHHPERLRSYVLNRS